MRGRFITFEGGEGTGKSTHASMLADTAAGVRHPDVNSPASPADRRAPRSCATSCCRARRGRSAPTPRRCCLRRRATTISPRVIRPALEQGKWVVCDRFADSTRIYQGVAGDVDPLAIRAMERIVVGDTKPDLTFILDVPAKEGMRRADKRRGGGRRRPVRGRGAGVS